MGESVILVVDLVPSDLGLATGAARERAAVAAGHLGTDGDFDSLVLGDRERLVLTHVYLELLVVEAATVGEARSAGFGIPGRCADLGAAGLESDSPVHCRATGSRGSEKQV